MHSKHKILGILRLSLGWIFFWAFIDKVWGLGYATEPGKAWLNGVSPTTGFLKFGTADSPLTGWFQSLAGQAWVDWLFMIGLLGIGLALILGIGIKVACWTGTILMLLLYAAALPVEHNLFMDEHLIYALVLLFFLSANVGHYWGLGRAWENTALVKNNSWLK